MANHKSAEKRARRNAERAKLNKARKSSIRTSLKKLDDAIKSGKLKDAEAAFKKVRPELSKGVAKGVLNKATVSRKVSRISARIKAMKKAAKE